ncbi:transposase domain-containing protein [Novosphingobium huizhouense]|uniref:transposase domain-containing protein n=1 Tax=Novosphingobium huizhouense TaxID=2866625 RepID=UPI001CD86C05|nr:transposase domain-containing protein [Novosphingobium huizhouense]
MAAPAAREWFTAAELADLALPGLPADKRAMNRFADERRWKIQADKAGNYLARPRAGRGGGLEFHVSLLPGPARIELARKLGETVLVEAEDPAASSWTWYELQGDKVKAAAEQRAAIVAQIELLEQSGLSRTMAVNAAAIEHGKSAQTIWNWLKLIDGVAPHNRLPALAPRVRGGGREAEIDDEIWRIFLSDYLRPEQPTLTSCYDRTAEIAKERGLDMPSERSVRRKLDREVDPRVQLLRRKGEEALRRSIPAQKRTVAELHALELVNIDGHKFDVFVRTGEGRVIRPIMVAIQDVYSRKFLAWRIGGEESAVQTRLCFADLFQNFGIPKACLLDNGRAFASKWITGGANSRFRFKIREEDPTGLLTGLGIQIHWATPYRGQSKPIERGFRDLCDRIAKHPAFAGAYVGNNPMAKPENYGSRAIDWAEFVAQVDKGMADHNARLSRRTESARGRSFDETFAESYARSPIGKATPEQMRLALLAGEQKRIDRQTGEIRLFGNRYWSPECGRLHGQQVTVRFDPDNLLRDVHLYDLQGRYLCAAQLLGDVHFLDAAEAKATAKRVAEYRRRIRDAVEAQDLLTAAQVASLQVDAPMPVLPEPQVIRPVRHRGQSAAALKPVTAPAQPEHESRVFAALKLVRPSE